MAASVLASVLQRATETVERAEVLDRPGGVLSRVTGRALRGQGLRDALHGVPLGHPLHPALSDVPMGTFTAATLLDVLPGTGAASSMLILAGLAASVPTAASGLADWSSLNESQQRVGIVHAGANTFALVCYAASLVARARRHRLSGKALAFAGLLASGGGGYLGGHLAYRQGAGVNHAEPEATRFPAGWWKVAPLTDIPDGRLSRREVEGVALLVHRQGNDATGLIDVCSHLGASLAGGEIVTEGGEACVRCPWHASTFRLRDGAVVAGPATSPQPSFRTLVTEGVLEVALPGGG